MDIGSKGNEFLKRFECLSGSTIKIIAIVTMFIDHLGATVLDRWFQVYGYYGLFTGALSEHDVAFAEKIYLANEICRIIGRMSFPLFCFLLVEGFTYTHNRKKYALRLFIFALISELPFDLAFWCYLDAPHWPFSNVSCNVFFTLFLGLVAMAIIDYVGKHHFLKEGILQKGVTLVIQLIAMLFIGAVADWMGTDYGSYGIYLMCLMYYFRGDKLIQILAILMYMVFYTPLMMSFKPMYLIALVCMLRYNGQKGKIRLKYFFYAFYPLHLILLTGCVCLLTAFYKVPFDQSYKTDKSICFYLNEKVYCTLDSTTEKCVLEHRNWSYTHLVVRNAKGASWIDVKVTDDMGNVIAETRVIPNETSEPLAVPAGNYKIYVSTDVPDEYVLRINEVYAKLYNPA